MVIVKGVIVPIVTPLKEGNQNIIDEDALEELCDFLIAKGVHSLFPCGTTGEGFLLPKETRKQLASLVVEKAKGRVSVIVQTGCIDTQSTIELTTHARDIGADGAAVIAPYFYRYEDDSLRNHFLAVARSVPDFPIYLYNNPARTNNDITPELLKSVVDEADNVVGIKHSHFDLRKISEYCNVLGENRVFLMGVDELLYPSYTLGASGCVAGNASVFPEPFVSLYHAFFDGDWVEAKKQQEMIIKIACALNKGTDISCFKAALRFRGINVGQTISPQKRLKEEEKLRLYEELKNLGLPVENPIF